MYLLYSLLLLVSFLARLPSFAYTAWRHGKSTGNIRERCGCLPAAINPDHRRSIWVHAVSVGEALAARPLIAGLREAYPDHRLLMSTTTVTGQRVARGFDDAVDGTFYFPFDLTPFIARALDRVAPDLVIVIDTEIWPNVLRACRRRGVRTILVNARLSARSYRGYRLARPFIRRVLADLDCVCVQTDAWRQRFVELGAAPARATVTGSLKFDALGLSATGAELHVGDRVLSFFRFAEGRPVLIAASTLRGEEEPVLRAFARIRETAPDAVLIVAPRHPERFAEARRLARADEHEVVLRTELPVDGSSRADVVVLDTIGELARLYQIATLVFVGGSLVPAGGHNILEPAVFGKAIVFGPHMENFAEIAQRVVTADAGIQVQTAGELEDTLVALMADPVRRAGLGAAARAIVDANRGATRRTLNTIAQLLPSGATPRAVNRRTLRAVQ